MRFLQIAPALAAALAFVSSQMVRGADDLVWDVMADTWTATDGLGRTTPGFDEAGPPRADRTTGIFYFLWSEGQNPVYDLSKILAANPDDPKFGPNQAFHHWAEPLFGYYRDDDAYVIRKHIQMLNDADVDVLFFDVTNALTYDSVRDAVLKVLDEFRASGQRTPRIAFLTNSASARTVEHLYKTFYKPGKGREHWFAWGGKPLILAPTDGLSDEVKDFFTIRRSWAWTKGHSWFGDGRDRWPWLDNSPQTPGWHEAPDKPEQISVTVAQHPTGNIGRSFHDGKQPPPEERHPERGLYFAEQWKRAREVDPPFVFITGWNEWIAQRFIDPKGEMSMGGVRLKPGGTFFVDQYTPEYSRDIEPVKGGFGDAYYYQLVSEVRRYKGVRKPADVAKAKVRVDGAFGDWKAAAPEFRDTIGDPARRRHPGWKGEPDFVNETGRNDLMAAKVAPGDEFVFFYIRTREPLTAPAERWMTLCIDADHDPKTGWLGYDLVVNREQIVDGMATVERLKPDGATEPLDAAAAVAFDGNELELALPRSALGLDFPGDGSRRVAFDFKWLDNVPIGGDASTFTLDGDAAPNDRFNYRATWAE
ncbi:hypothetical protein [Planctomyces sp. SH-PL62]|uniref:hypothetical protein n=1 Tax=Planctomyces sp. SH-PL62 TaxID=1636152 RepID=UPI00078C7D14|nr:hypothetical protein [Planctomyces sp. SH-PL62]AMV38617.1 hypothetical protein VT85_14360 [Planctomyces sp. SH-PL62]